MKEKENSGRKVLIAIAVAVAAIATKSCGIKEPHEVERTVELHYVNGEVETRVLRGSTLWPPTISTNYGEPYYKDGCNHVYGVVRFRVLHVDTLSQKGGAL